MSRVHRNYSTCAWRLRLPLLLCALLGCGSASATWSIAADNPGTGTIAVAGASCSYMVYGIAQAVPGKGLVIVQAASSDKARTDAAGWLADGMPLPEILKRLSATDSDYAPDEQQYALLRVGDALPVGFTGDAVEGFKGSRSARHVTVQANTMASDQVVPRTFAALHPADWTDDASMADAVIAALQAGAAAGGDKRCARTGSATAFLSLYRTTDNPRQPWLTLAIYGLEPGSQDAVSLLAQRYRSWRAQDMGAASTQLFLLPGKDADGAPE